MKSFFDPVSGRPETVEITRLGEGGGHRFRNARSGFSRYLLENRTCYKCGQKGHLSANCPQKVRRVSLTEGSIKYEGAGETQLRLRLQSNVGYIPQHEPQEDDARPEDSASQVGAHQFLGTMSTLGVGAPGGARKRLPSPPPAPPAPLRGSPCLQRSRPGTRHKPCSLHRRHRQGHRHKPCSLHRRHRPSCRRSSHRTLHQVWLRVQVLLQVLPQSQSL